MAITLYSGLPRSGKTYRMVYDMYKARDRYFIIHNIDGLKEGLLGDFGFNWVEYCEKEKIEVDDFFSKDYQIELSKHIRKKYKREMLIIIDEAHEWFDHHVKNLKMWLSYHGHLGQTIWLVSHRSQNIPSVYRSFVEIEYRAKHSQIISIPKLFVYNKIFAGEKLGYDFRIKRQAIFDLYKSQQNDFKATAASPILLISIIAICLGVWFYISVPQRLWGNKDIKKSVSIEKQLIQNSINDYSENKNIYYAGKIGDVIYLSINGQLIRHKDCYDYIIMNDEDYRLLLAEAKTGKEFYVYQNQKAAAVAEQPPSGSFINNNKNSMTENR